MRVDAARLLADLGPRSGGPVRRIPTVTLAAMPFLSDDPAALFADLLAREVVAKGTPGLRAVVEEGTAAGAVMVARQL